MTKSAPRRRGAAWPPRRPSSANPHVQRYSVYTAACGVRLSIVDRRASSSHHRLPCWPDALLIALEYAKERSRAAAPTAVRCAGRAPSRRRRARRRAHAGCLPQSRRLQQPGWLRHRRATAARIRRLSRLAAASAHSHASRRRSPVPCGRFHSRLQYPGEGPPSPLSSRLTDDELCDLFNH